jgi:hypothetical protein
MSEDWKGEQFIRGLKPTLTERHAETSRLSAAVRAKATPKQKQVTPVYSAMSRVMQAAMAESRALHRQSKEGA